MRAFMLGQTMFQIDGARTHIDSSENEQSRCTPTVVFGMRRRSVRDCRTRCAAFIGQSRAPSPV
jgi:hypothetical protein